MPELKHFLKEAALKTAVAGFYHQEKVNRKTDPPATRRMTTTLKRDLAQCTIPAVFLSWLLGGRCGNTDMHLYQHRYCSSPGKLLVQDSEEREMSSKINCSLPFSFLLSSLPPSLSSSLLPSISPD